jgi:trigger factor
VQEALDVVGDPEIVTEQAEGGAPLRYSATVEVKPDVVADHYVGLPVERPVIEISDGDVDTYLERLRESLAQFRPVTDRRVVDWGDVVTLDYEARCEGRLLGRGEQRPIEIGKNSFPPEFDRALVGADIGAAREFEVAYPADASVAELAGKTVRFRVQLHALSLKELPVLDDEFAKDHGECDSLDELRVRARKRLEAEAGRHADDAMRRGLLSELAKAHDIPVPQAMVARRTEALLEEARRELYGGTPRRREPPEVAVQLRRELQPRAQEQVKVALLLEAIVRQEGIEVGETDIDEHIAELAAQAGSGSERVRSLYENQDLRRQLRDRIAQSRAIDAVARRAKITNVQSKSGVAALPENG